LQVKIPAVDLQQANLSTIDIGQAKIGPINVDQLTISNTDLAMAASNIVMHHVTVVMFIHIELVITVHINFLVGSYDNDFPIDFGTLKIPPDPLPALDLGDLSVPGITNIKLHIPTLLAQTLAVDADPLALKLNKAAANTIHVVNATVPASGFSITGLSLTSASGSAITVPDAQVDSAAIAHLTGDPVKIPTFGLKNLTLPVATIPVGPGTPPAPGITSTAPLDLGVQLPMYGFSAGRPHKDIVAVTLDVTPFTKMHVDALDIASATASATVGSIVLQNVTLPYDVLNLTLSQIGINSIQVPTFNLL
jgi:hypothetical protein